MKKLKLKNLKVVKLDSEAKKAIKGGTQIEWDTSGQCNRTSGPYVSWCHGCE
ncbi:hypothetical protein [uncultured Flavobacterium sp.]|jgi:hypothetical protein|uniref:hypothetical protein n=1 Tax=uncultured Flavobacterium sp. TaxID=165435 RepID=UPI003081DC18